MVGGLRIGVALGARLALALALGAGPAMAKPGQVDTRYGYNGTVDVTDALPGPEFQRGVLAEAVGPQDESVVLSYATGPARRAHLRRPLRHPRPRRRHARRRLRRPGRRRRLGRMGRPGRPGEGPRGAIAVQPDGKVVVATGDGPSARVARLNPDGSHDGSFRDPAEPARPGGEVSVLARRRGDRDRPGAPRREARSSSRAARASNRSRRSSSPSCSPKGARDERLRAPRDSLRQLPARRPARRPGSARGDRPSWVATPAARRRPRRWPWRSWTRPGPCPGRSG